jgi:CRISPR-associated protein Cas5a/b/c
MRGFVFDVEYCWGFQARIAGMSKTSSSYLFPPPSTILGAIAESYNRRKGKSESEGISTMINLSKKVISLTFRSINAIPISFQDLNRIIAIRTSAGEEYPSTVEVYKSFDAPARGKTILSSIDDKPPSLRVVMIVDADLIAEDFWKIKRIGSKESLVSVINVEELSVEKIGKEFETKYAVPILEGVETQGMGEFVYEFYVPIENGKLMDSPSKMYLQSKAVKYMIGLPYRDYNLYVKLKNNYVGYKVGNEIVMGIES